MVVTQLANAFERGSLCAGDKVCLGVESTGKEGEAVISLKIEKASQSATDAPVKDINFVPF